MARTGSSPPLYCFVINTETESRNYMTKYEEISMALVKKVLIQIMLIGYCHSSNFKHNTRTFLR